MPTRKQLRDAKAANVRLKPADSFDLIRLLAQTQSDARKALGELVQNSLDAQAAHVEIAWFREKSAVAISVHDDGEGIFPDLPRDEALRRIATTIGHSHKRDLTPAARRELMLAGKYGIGLLGFWAVGRVMEIRSRVGGGETWCLRLVEGSPQAELLRVPRQRLHELETYTEVTIKQLHEGAVRQVRPARLQAYLASELRGQLLDREVELTIRDRIARGRAIKEFRVRALRYRGRRLDEMGTLVVPGHEDARLDLYLVVEEDRSGTVALACGGTTVLDDIAWIDGTGQARMPWCLGRFEGVVDFPMLEVVPGTRRGFRHNEAAEAFLAALGSVERALQGLLDAEERRRAEERDRNLAREVRRAFRTVARVLSHYDLFDLRGSGSDGAGNLPQGAEVAEDPLPREPAAGAADDGGAPHEEGDPAEEAALFEPGPLHGVRLSPARLRLPLGASRVLRAKAVDADGRPPSGDVTFLWSLSGAGSLDSEGPAASYTAPEHPCQSEVHVAALQGAQRAEASAEVKVVEDLEAEQRAVGIPDPMPLHAPAESWRSRIRDKVWQYNTGHRDYVAASVNEARRLRYLVHLFAKEVVLRNFAAPGAEDLLERMVEVLTYLGEGRTTTAGGSAAPPPRDAAAV